MISIKLQEQGTYNEGMGIDIEFDLDSYSDSTEITEELFEQTKEHIEDNEIKYSDIDNLEEWIITDIEIDSEYLSYDSFFNENMSLDLLIELNEFLNENDEYDISLAMYLDQGYDLKSAIGLIESEDITPYLIGNMEYKSEEVLLGEWLVYESEFFEDLSDKYKNYIDFKRFSQEYGQDMITHTFKNGKVYALMTY